MNINLLLRRHLLGATVAAAAVFCTPVSAGQTNTSISATVTTQETVAPNVQGLCPSGYQLVGSTTGTGTVPQLGRVTLVATDCILLNQLGQPVRFDNGQLTLTAANGDELKATYTGGTLTPIDNTAGLPLFNLEAPVIITGGTGRFAGASGSGYLRGAENLATGQGQFKLTASISY